MNPTLVCTEFEVNADAVPQVKPSYLVCSNAVATSTPKSYQMLQNPYYKSLPEVRPILKADGWRGYDELVDIGYDKHLRVNNGSDESAHGSNHVSGIESFWGYAKRRMVQFNGVHKHTFLLHLKETGFRFNNRHLNLYKVLLLYYG